MRRKAIWKNGSEIFFEYNFRMRRVIACSWSATGNKLGWLTDDHDSCFLHVWDRIAATYDAIELLRVRAFSFKRDERYILFTDENSIVFELDLQTLNISSIFETKIIGVKPIKISPNGNLVAISSRNADLKIFDKSWNLVFERKIQKNRNSPIRSREICVGISWSPDSNSVALAGLAVTVVNIFTGSQKKFVTGSGIYETVWSPDGRFLAAASVAKTILIWEVHSETPYRVLEGHKSEVRSVSFSANGELLASQSSDGVIIIWNCENWSTVEVSQSNARARLPARSLVFHPSLPWLAHTGKSTVKSELATLLLSRFDLDVVRRNVSSSTITYASAKIVLVGESGAGKTGLGWRLANNDFKEHASTHGQQFWVVDKLSSQRRDGTQCEAVVWDLAGQPDYRLIHALFLDDVDLALVLFDPTKGDDPLYGVDYWLKQLARRKPTGKTNASPPVILVAARVDRGSSRLTTDEIKSFCNSRGLIDYLGTSAKTGEGLSDLVSLMSDNIPWAEKPATVTTATFKNIKDMVLRLKEVPSIGQSIVSLDELRRHLKVEGISAEFSKDELLSAVGHLATHGYVAILRSSKGESRVLLVPELLNNLAASIVLEARRNIRGLGALDEDHILEAEKHYTELTGLTLSERLILLDSTVSMLLENNVCYRETDPLNSRAYLVFPELINLRMPELDDNVETTDDVSYTVSGAISNVYASLVVLLGYTDRFTRTHQWRDHARYEFGNGMICGFRLESGRETELNFVLYFGSHVKKAAKGLFISLFENFLASRDVTVQRYLPIRCSLDHTINRSVVREQFLYGLSYAHCPRCGQRVELPEQNQTIQLTAEETNAVEYEERAARQRSILEKAIYLLKSYVLQKELKVPSCFISYAWGDIIHERWVERFANDLMNAGISVILDRWDNEIIGSSVPRFVERAAAADRIIVIGTPIYRAKYQNKDPMSAFVVAAEGDIIGGRMISTEGEKMSIMPVLLSGSVKQSFPDLLHGRVYCDFREGDEYAMQMMKFLTGLYEIKTRERIFTEIRNIFDEY